MRPKKTKAIIIAACDGIACMYSGVGVVIDFFIESLENNHFAEITDNYDVHFVSTYLSEKCPEYDSKRFEKVNDISKKFGGQAHFIKTLVSGDVLDDIWAGDSNVNFEDQWKSCSKNLAVFSNELKRNRGYKSIKLIAHDTIFALTSYNLQSTIDFCWIPHSIGSVFEDNYFSKRFEFEKEGINKINELKYKVGYISFETKKILIDEYGLNKDLLISFYSGINTNSQKYALPEGESRELEKNLIPEDKKIIFTWGRCVEQKGIDLVIQGLNEFLKEHPSYSSDYHLVLICPTLTTSPKYYKEITTFLKDLRCNFSFIESFENKLPFEILKNKKTDIVILASRFEGFGLTSIETLKFCNSNARIIYSSINTFKEVFEAEQRAFCSLNHSVESYKEALEKAIIYTNTMINYDEKKEKKFDFVSNQMAGLKEYILDETIKY